jgi:glycosyl transferase family 87
MRPPRGSPYDLAFEAAGGFGLFYYPPTFLPLVLPFGALDPVVAKWLWTALLVGAFWLGVALMPVSRSVRWQIVLLAGLSWPFIYSIKLGQVGPLLFLSFAAGWRWMDRPIALGLSAAAGTAIKLQPVLLLGWAVLTGRSRAAMWGALVLLGVGVGATLVAGFAGWLDFTTLMRQLGDPMLNEHNMAPGAVLYRLGMPLAMAGLLQLLSAAAVMTLAIAAAARATAQASFLAAVVASQMIWPVVWEHYAMLLLLPVAYLLSIGWRWAAIIPLATATVLVAVTPAIVYPIAFYATLIATVAAGTWPALVQRAAKPSFA